MAPTKPTKSTQSICKLGKTVTSKIVCILAKYLDGKENITRVCSYMCVHVYIGESQSRDFTWKTVCTARLHIPNCCWQQYSVQNYLQLAINIYILHQDGGGSHIAVFSKCVCSMVALLSNPHHTTITTNVHVTANFCL